MDNSIPIKKIIAEVRDFLTQTFADIDTWFDKDPSVLNAKPITGGWTSAQILEHIGLTNHFLLILIEKGTQKALNNVQNLDLQDELANYEFHWDKLDAIGQHKSFVWMRPEHMKPKGEKTLAEVRLQLYEQVQTCLGYLDRLKNGEGVLYKTKMSVNDLGKIDVYEYIYFLAQHGQRHKMQMMQNEIMFAIPPQ